MVKEKKQEARDVISGEIEEFLEILNRKEIGEDMRVNLRRAAETRGLLGANLEFIFQRNQETPYYNIYRYAFFGKVPEVLEELGGTATLHPQQEKTHKL
ncbi:MAG: hypothetical protein MUF15_10215 [Acidobacteria bacterium]|jgi:hypothetical protein|nr:hypothetical protein [Acidobacteriota bacterium]